MPDPNGYRWVKRSYRGWLKILTAWSFCKVRRAFLNFVEKNIILTTKDPNSNANIAYRINYPAINIHLHPDLAEKHANYWQIANSFLQNANSSESGPYIGILLKDSYKKDLKEAHLRKLSSTNSSDCDPFFSPLNETQNPPNNESGSQSLSDAILAVSKMA